MCRRITALLFFCWLGSSSLVAGAAPGGLFSSHEPLAIEIYGNFGDICDNPLRRECPDIAGLIIYKDDANIEHRIETGLRIRGRWQSHTADCSLPSLFLILKAEATAGTLFEGQGALPLTTHCRTSSRFEQYLLKEFLAYRLYNLLTDKSLRVRLVQITYFDTKTGSPSPLTRYGFFIEHFKSLARRVDAEVWEPEAEFDPVQSDTMELDIQALFQYMIGNTDWSIIYGHNIMYLRDSERVTPVPFDFDYSGLVNAAYAEPGVSVSLRRVTQRAYRGFCRVNSDWPALFAYFNSQYDAIFNLAADVPGLSDSQRRRAERYLESFFDILRSAKQRENKIVKRCR